MREGEATQHNALDELPGFGPAFEADHLREHGSNGLDFGKPLARARQVVERPGGGVEIPLPRLVQEFKSAFRIVKVTRRELEDGALAEADDVFLFVHADDRQARLDPAGHRHHFGVGDCVPRFQVTLAEAEAGVALRPLGRLVHQVRDAEVTPLGVPGAGGPLAIDP